MCLRGGEGVGVCLFVCSVHFVLLSTLDIGSERVNPLPVQVIVRPVNVPPMRVAIL